MGKNGILGCGGFGEGGVGVGAGAWMGFWDGGEVSWV